MLTNDALFGAGFAFSGFSAAVFETVFFVAGFAPISISGWLRLLGLPNSTKSGTLAPWHPGTLGPIPVL